MQLIPDPIPEYDGATYLDANPDVAAAVADRKFASGWAHFLQYGYREARSGVPEAVVRAVQAHWSALEGNPASNLPPCELRARVHGNADIADYVMTGKRIADDLSKEMHSEGVIVDTMSNVLDFGCGCGRVLRPFRDFHPNACLQGSDIDSAAIDWATRHLSQLATFTTNGHLPDRSFTGDHYDLIYSISVFTHLPEYMQFAWLNELERITRPGGILLITVHGMDLSSSTSAVEIDADTDADQFRYVVGSGTYGLPTFYQNTFHSDSYILQHWTKYFHIRRIVRRAIAQHQDLVVCEKR